MGPQPIPKANKTWTPAWHHELMLYIADTYRGEEENKERGQREGEP